MGISASEAVLIFCPLAPFSRARSVIACLVGYLKASAWYSGLALGVFVLMFEAHWFVEVRCAIKICVRLLTMRRRAPAIWAFFRTGVPERGVPETLPEKS